MDLPFFVAEATSHQKMSDTSAEYVAEMMKLYIRSLSLNLDIQPLENLLNKLSDEVKMKVIMQEDEWCKPLRCAIAKSHTDIITVILISLEPVNRLQLLTIREFTPLHQAAFYGNFKVVRCILNCLSAEQQLTLITTQDEEYKTAVHRALQGGSSDTIRVLLKCFTVNQRVSLLSELHANGRSVVQEAAWLGYSKLLTVILQSLPTYREQLQVISAKDMYGSNAIHTAVLKDHPETVKVLLSCLPTETRFLMISQFVSDNSIVVHKISLRGFTQILKVVLGLLPSELRMKLLSIEDTSYSRTAIHWAADRGQTESVETILECLPPQQQLKLLGMRDRDHKTALQLAERLSRKVTHQLLQRYHQLAAENVDENELGKFSLCQK